MELLGTFSVFGWVYFAAINAAGFVMMGLDKSFAKNHQWRIPEKWLLVPAFVGGAWGSWAGMYTFRHKTKHAKFVVLEPLLSAATAAVMYWMLFGSSAS